jgi:hypothetical protein
MWTAIFIGVAFTFLGFALGRARTLRQLGPAVQEAYELGIEDGKKEVTEGLYRTPASMPPAPPPNPFIEQLVRISRMIASSGIWLDEESRADWERRNNR